MLLNEILSYTQFFGYDARSNKQIDTKTFIKMIEVIYIIVLGKHFHQKLS